MTETEVFAHLREHYEYLPDTGFFRTKTGNLRLRAGRIVGTPNADGYYQITLTIKGVRKNFLAHRLAWLYVYGRWPKLQIDHINRVKSDNRINNLREVTAKENNANRVYTQKTGRKPKARTT